MRGANRGRGGRTGRLVLSAVLVAAVAAGAVAATGIGGTGGGTARQARSTLPTVTAKVSRGTLVDRQTESGQLSYGDTTTVTGKLAGTVTSLPTAGSVVKKGEELYRVDNTPVVLLYGSLPSYRDLKTGEEGADVKQFEQNLYDLGYHGFTVGTSFTDATATAVKKWQKALGLTQTGTVEQGRVHYTPGAIRIDSDKAALGDSAKPGDAVVTCTGTAREAVVKLDMASARLAVKDSPVTVKLPNATSAPGKISATRTVLDTSSGSGGGGAGGSSSDTTKTKIEVDVAFDDPNAVNGLDQATVDVGFAASKRENVLTVPVAALLSLAEGGYGVQLVDGANTRTVAVQTGLFADGKVEVSGDAVTEGATVGMPS